MTTELERVFEKWGCTKVQRFYAIREICLPQTLSLHFLTMKFAKRSSHPTYNMLRGELILPLVILNEFFILHYHLNLHKINHDRVPQLMVEFFIDSFVLSIAACHRCTDETKKRRAVRCSSHGNRKPWPRFNMHRLFPQEPNHGYQNQRSVLEPISPRRLWDNRWKLRVPFRC